MPLEGDRAPFYHGGERTARWEFDLGEAVLAVLS